MGSLFGGGSSPAPAPAPPPPDTSAAETAARNAAARDEAIRRVQQGRASTIATGMMGDTSEANTSVVKLLGA